MEEPLAETAPDPLRRYQGVQAASLVLAIGGFLVLVTVLALYPGLIAGEAPPGSEAFALLLALILSGLAVVTGLVMNAVRAVVVREALPAWRYRGPSLIVLTLLAALISNAMSLAVAGDLLALTGGEAPSVAGSLLLLTATQLGLLAAAALFVLLPGALSGLRLLPERGLGRSIATGALWAVPAWIGAQTAGVVIVWLLGMVGMEPETGIVEAALEHTDPIVLVIALVVVAPVAEEVYFRGVVFAAWEREYGYRRALYGSAVLFGAIHGSVFGFLPFAVLGVVLAVLYRRNRSLPAAIALHAVFNTITVAITLLVRNDVIQLAWLPS